MNEWTAGYVADIEYTFGYYSELNPLRVKLAFLNQGLVYPKFERACELGYGRGLSINVHAAASPTQWYGTDFNPSQAAVAIELANAAGSNAHLYDASFEEMLARDDIPEFDYIGLHGIWSWVSDHNRKVITKFIQKKLKVGGVLYVSYNTMPGWSSFVPVRNILNQYIDTSESQSKGIVANIESAFDFADRLFKTDPLFVKANPTIAERLKGTSKHNKQYLAHEFFNKDWHPMPFAAMADWMEGAKLQYACSAHYLDYIENLNITPEQQTFLNEITDAVFKQSIRDFMVNQQFRRDYWVKGARKMHAIEQMESIRSVRVVLVLKREDVSLTVKGVLGEAQMSEMVYEPILDAIAKNIPITIAEIEKKISSRNIAFSQLVQALLVLAGAGLIYEAQDENVVKKVRKSTDDLNRHIMRRARGADDISHLASPVTGGGIQVGRFNQLFLLAILEGRTTTDAWASFAWQSLSVLGQKLLKEGVVIETDEENIRELKSKAEEFDAKHLAVYKALQII